MQLVKYKTHLVKEFLDAGVQVRGRAIVYCVVSPRLYPSSTQKLTLKTLTDRFYSQKNFHSENTSKETLIPFKCEIKTKLQSKTEY